MCSTDGDRADVWTETGRKARKDHRCTECGRTIVKSEIYWRAFTLFDGRCDTYKTCTHCRVGQAWLIDNCGIFLHHGLDEEMAEHAEDYPSIRFGFLRIRVGMHRKWQRFDGAGLMPLPPAPRDVAHVMEHAG